MGRGLASRKEGLELEKKELQEEKEELEREKRKIAFGDGIKPSEVIFRVTGLFDSLHDEESSSVIVSDLQPSFGFEWKQRWSFSWHRFLGFELAFKSYKGNTFENKVVTHRKFKGGRNLWRY